MHVDGCGSTFRQKCHANGSRNKLKYKSLCKEIQWMWNLKFYIMPLIIGGTWLVTRGLRRNLEAIPGKHSIDSLQVTAILATSHIITKVLQSGNLSLSSGDHHWFKRSITKKRPVTRDDNNNNNNMQNILYAWNNFTCSTNCIHRTAATLLGETSHYVALNYKI